MSSDAFVVGAKLNVPEDQHIEDVRNVLSKLPKVHLYVLDAVIRHIKKYALRNDLCVSLLTV